LLCPQFLGLPAIDGDLLPIDFTPSCYIPDASAPEACDEDSLAAHLKGIDTALCAVFPATTTYRPWYDDLSVPSTLFVTTTGNDVTGDGTALLPYATVLRALKDIPINGLIKRTISLGAGSFAFPATETLNENISIVGTTSVKSSHTISSVSGGTEATGLGLNVAGTPWTTGPESERGEILQWTSGALSGDYGVIYRNTTSRVDVEQDTQNAAFAVPVATDTFDILSMDTTLTLSGTAKLTINGNFFQFHNMNITGDSVIQTNVGTTAFLRCRFNGIRRLNIGEASRLNTTTCWIAPTGDTNLGLVTVRNQGRWGANGGCVVDAINSTAAKGFIQGQNEGVLTRSGGMSLRDLGTNGIRLTGCQVQADTVNNPSGYFTDRFIDAVNGYNLELAQAILPDLHGNITGSYCVAGTNHTWACLGSGSAVTTGLGTNTVSADGGVTNTAGQTVDMTYIKGGDPDPTDTPTVLRTEVVPAGVKNGVNTIYTTPDFYQQDSPVGIMVHFNGMRLLEGATDDFVASESGGAGTGFDTITLAVAPKSKDQLHVDYYIAP
jgi:hypothetical protein